MKYGLHKRTIGARMVPPAFKEGLRDPLVRLSSSPLLFKVPVVTWIHDAKMKKYTRTPSDFLPPPKLRVETTNRCNAACRICPHHAMKRPQGVMEFSLYRKIVDEASRMGVRYLQLNAIGEPLLDPGLVEKIEYARSGKIESVYLFTNGSLLTRGMSAALLGSGLDMVKISLDGFSREEYETARPPLKFNVVIENILHLLRLRELMGTSRPKVIIEAKPLNGNKKSAKASSIYSELRTLADAVRLFPQHKIHDWAGQNDTNQSYVRFYSKVVRRPCPRLWTTLCVSWNGTVPLCCLDYEESEVLGDLSVASIEEVWRGSEFERVRGLHAQGKFNDIELCSTCLERMNWWTV